jgi:hypothetical protein
MIIARFMLVGEFNMGHLVKSLPIDKAERLTLAQCRILVEEARL